jgi:hypothetical protein
LLINRKAVLQPLQAAPTVGSSVYVNYLPKDYYVRLYNNASDPTAPVAAEALIAAEQFVTLPLNAGVTGPIAVSLSTSSSANQGYKYTVPLTNIPLNPASIVFNSPNSAVSFSVYGVQPGQVVRVYASPFDLTSVSTKAVAGGQNFVSFNNLAITGSTVYVTVAADANTLESARTPAGHVTIVSINNPSIKNFALSLTAGGAAATLTVSTVPVNPINTTVTWTSSNTSVATVNSSGVVTPISKGTAIIYAYVDGRPAFITVNVS